MLRHWPQLLLLSFVTASGFSAPVRTSSGLLTGLSDTLGLEFLGVKYGEATRFGSSDLSASNGSFTAATLPPFCPQQSQSHISEDCLYLNVYVPPGESKNLPVMVWVHGGSFQEGGSADPTFNGTFLAHEQNVIVVTLNYRLGTLGFYLADLADPTPAATDIVTALRWVQNNIAAFGGDTSRVTLFGESSGGTLIRALSTSSALTGLFSRVIIESDPQLGYEISAQQARNTSLSVLEANNVTTTAELEKRSVEELLQSDQKLPQIGELWPDHTTFFNPWVDGKYIAGQFARLASEGKIPQRDFLLGTVKNESAAALAPLAELALANQLPSNIAVAVLAEAFGNDPTVINSILSDPTLFPPTTNQSSSELTEVINLSVLATKAEFECPTALNAKYLRQSGINVYLFRFDEGIRYVANEGSPLCSQPSEVCHEDDLNAVFGNTDPSEKLGITTRKYWADFAKSGAPGWELFDIEKEQLYSLGTSRYIGAGESDAQCAALYRLHLYA